MSNSILDYNHPLQIIESNVPGARDTPHQGGTVLFGLWMSQNQNGPILFDTLFKNFINKGEKIGRIIEIGTAHGGLSVLFGVFALTCGCKAITYDIEDTPNYKDLFVRLGVDFRKRDVFASEQEIVSDIQGEGKTVLFCDGGNKTEEFRRFAPHLKIGDVIVAHDYSPDETYFNLESRNNIWSFYELNYAAIKDTVESCGLKPLYEKEALSAAMCCFQKTE